MSTNESPKMKSLSKVPFLALVAVQDNQLKCMRPSCWFVYGMECLDNEVAKLMRSCLFAVRMLIVENTAREEKSHYINYLIFKVNFHLRQMDVEANLHSNRAAAVLLQCSNIQAHRFAAGCMSGIFDSPFQVSFVLSKVRLRALPQLR